MCPLWLLRGRHGVEANVRFTAVPAREEPAPGLRDRVDEFVHSEENSHASLRSDDRMPSAFTRCHPAARRRMSETWFVSVDGDPAPAVVYTDRAPVLGRRRARSADHVRDIDQRRGLLLGIKTSAATELMRETDSPLAGAQPRKRLAGIVSLGDLAVQSGETRNWRARVGNLPAGMPDR